MLFLFNLYLTEGKSDLHPITFPSRLYTRVLVFASTLAICFFSCYIISNKEKVGIYMSYPQINVFTNALPHQPFTSGYSGRLIFSLEDCITQTNKSNNECTKLKKFHICNHQNHPPFFRLEGLSLQ